ncbi:hypothetical protein V1509DRAFT_636648 [Lipomyces kononenkoae]
MRTDMKADIECCYDLQVPSMYKALGISGRSPLIDLPTLYWPESFPIDVMHLILEGIVPRTFAIWVEAAKSKSPIVEDLTGLGKDIKDCKYNVPAALARSPEDVCQNHNSYRAQNWFDFLQLFAHPLLDGRASPDVRKNMALLARIYSIATQEQISPADLGFMDRAVKEFVESYECLYTDPTVCTSNLHGLLHLPECIKNCGPAWAYWQFTMEKTCGNVVRLLQGKKLKDENLANAILLNEQINLLRWRNPGVRLSWEEVFLSRDANPRVGDVLDRIQTPSPFTNEQINAILEYFDIDRSSAQGHDMVNLLQQKAVHFRKYQANSEDIVSGKCATTGPSSRCRQYVNCQNINNEVFFGEVARIFSFHDQRREHNLALLHVFQDVQHSDDFYGRVQKLRSRDSYLVCIDVTDIDCAVGIISNTFIQSEYILNRNWVDCDPNSEMVYEDLLFIA